MRLRLHRSYERYLKKFDIVGWRNLNKKYAVLPLLKKIEVNQADRLSVLLIFCFLSESIEQGIVYDFSYYDCLAVGFSTAILSGGVDCKNLPKYIRVFISPKIQGKLYEKNMIDISHLTLELVKSLSLEDFDRHNYDLVYFYLSNFEGVPYSPLFKNDYSLVNVYRALEEFMRDKKYEIFFTALGKKI